MEEETLGVARARAVRVQVDLNSRSRDGFVVARLSRSTGPVALGSVVSAFEPDDEVAAPARVARIDRERGLIYLDVDWDALDDDILGMREVTVSTHAGTVSSNSPSPLSLLINVTQKQARKFMPASSSAGVRIVNLSGLTTP